MKLQDIVDIKTGYQFRKGLEEDLNGNAYAIALNAVNFQSQVLEPQKFIKIQKNEAMEKLALTGRELLFVAKGSVNIAIKPSLGELDLIPIANFLVLRPHSEKVIPEFLLIWLNNRNTQQKVNSIRSVGSTMPFVSLKELSEIEINLPSLEVQKKLILLDELNKREQALRRRQIELNSKLVEEIISKHLSGAK